MNKTACIWDLDGTLVDSYGIIVSSLRDAYREFGIELDPEEIRREVIIRSVGDFITQKETETGIPFEQVKAKFSEINDSRKLNIPPMEHAAELLCCLRDRAVPNFVFTHKGTSTQAVLKNIGLYEFFEEIITGKDGFPRKPDPAAVLYLIRKHDLAPGSTFYIGDRSLDIECAVNAGIKSILYLPKGSAAEPTGKETFIVKDLLEIKDLV